MKSQYLLSVIALALSLALLSCSELKKDLPSPVSGAAAIHPEGWNQTSSPDFHGTYLKAKAYDTKECKPCHGGPFTGGTSQTSCFRCHALYPHSAAWIQTASADFHGRFLKAMNYDAGECKSCHGVDFTGGSSQVACFSCHTTFPHAATWTAGHGQYLKGKNWTDTECQSCHGTDYAGGTSGVACFSCHDPYPHAVRFPSGLHTNYLYPNGYPLGICQTCHGADYTGGHAGVSCMQPGCHVDQNGVPKSPEVCNTCHGVFRAPASDFLSAAPPKGVLGDTAQTYRGVGAHQKHLLTGTLGKSLKCQECHRVPSTFSQPGHIDTKLPAEVAMNDTLSRLVTGDGSVHPSPVWNGTTCANTYCHGNWKLLKSSSQFPGYYNATDTAIVGAAFSPEWTGGSPQATCGTCHGLPPQGHQTAITECYACHFDVNASMQIIDPTQHMNGKVNFLSNEYPMH